ncbi:MAG: phosphoglucomutase, alpha-D-glucose phosphate-specific, partial [Anaerolineae bacterium]
MPLHPLAGQPAPYELRINVPRLIAAYYTDRPDPREPANQVAFGTSGHRGTSLEGSFNEDHILAICQAICEIRWAQGISGPLFIGMDTHALSEPALYTALEVFAANGVDVMVQAGLGYTPTPVISHAILTYNRGRSARLADGVVITPSHNPPADGGFKYNPPSGGPAAPETTRHIQERANELLRNGLQGVKRVPVGRALRAETTHMHDYIGPYVRDLKNVIRMDAIAAAGLKIGADPMGGAGVAYWGPTAEMYRLNIEVINPVVDPT